MEEIEKRVYSVPVSAFLDDIKRCGIKGSTNRMTNIMRHRAFDMLSVFWIIQTTGMFLSKGNGCVWISKAVSKEIGTAFDSNFSKLCKLNKSRYERKFGFGSYSTSSGYKYYDTTYYRINSNSGKCGKGFKLEQIDEKHELYEGINHLIEKVERYLQKSKELAKQRLRPSESKFVEKYYSLCLSEENAITILEYKYGISLADAIHYKDLSPENKSKKTLVKIHKAQLFYKQYIEIKKFNSKYYKVTAKYCRIYTELHNVVTEVRDCLCSSTGERMVEVYDMHGAFAVGYFTMCATVASELGYEELANKLKNYTYNLEGDPYRFALKGMFANDRDIAKDATMFYLFSDLAIHNYRSFYIGNMKKMNNYEEMVTTCKKFLDICERYGSVLDYLDADALDDIFSEVDFTPEFWYVLTKKKYNKLSFHNTEPYKTLRSNPGFEDMNKGGIYFITLKTVVDAVYKAMLHYHIEQCMREEFGDKAVYVSDLILNIFYDKAMKILKPLQERLKRKYPKEKVMSLKELAKGNVPNASVVCQVAEGWTMIDNIVPELCDKTGCQDIVTIHDAILVPESIARKINVKELNMKVVSMFIMNVEYAFKHIDAYFNGENEAPFSYVA
jgi:hypothetical protein